MPNRKATAASAYVKGDYGRVSADDYRERVLESDACAAADNRTDAQRWLGDPAPGRSALDARATPTLLRQKLFP